MVIFLGSATERTSCGQLIVNFGRVSSNRLKQKCSVTDGKLRQISQQLTGNMYCLINDGNGNEKDQVPYSLQIVLCFHSSPKCEPVSFFIAYADLKMFKTEKFVKERSCTQINVN